MRSFFKNSIVLSWGSAMITFGVGLRENSDSLMIVSAILAILSLVLVGIAFIYFYNKVWKNK